MRISNPSSGFQIRRGGGSVVANSDGTISVVGNTDITGTLDVTGTLTGAAGAFSGQISALSSILNQGGADTAIQFMRSSDVITGLTSGPPFAITTNDYGVFGKASATIGGLAIIAIGEPTGSNNNLVFESWGGVGNTDHGTGARGLVEFRVYQHSGGAIAQPDADTNIYVIRTWTGSAVLARWALDEDGDTWQNGGAVIGGTLEWGGGATIADSNKVRPDYAAIRFDDNASAETIDLTDQYHLVDRFATNGLDEVSTADQANNRLTVGDGRDYRVEFCGSAEAAGGSKTFVFDVFEISQSTANITGITQATPGVVTASGHGFTDGNLCKITGVVGMTEVNDKIFKVAGVSGANFNLQDDEGVNIATGVFGAWSSGGTVALATKTFAHSDRTFSNASGFGSFSSHWFYAGTSGDAMEFYLKNKTDATDLTFEHLNLTISGL